MCVCLFCVRRGVIRVDPTTHTQGEREREHKIRKTRLHQLAHMFNMNGNEKARPQQEITQEINNKTGRKTSPIPRQGIVVFGMGF